MMKKRNEQGFALAALILILIAVISVGGGVIYLSNRDDDDSNVITSTSNVNQEVHENVGNTTENNSKDNTEDAKEKDLTPKTEVPKDYIGIYNIEDYQKFFTGEFELDKNYILMNDLDFAGVENCKAIGYREDLTYCKEFTGVFDGNHHTIFNFKISPDAEDYLYTGFFGCIKFATIKNLNFKDAIFRVDKKTGHAGILVGEATNSLIDNCDISAVIEFDTNETEISAEVGIIADTVVANMNLYEKSNDIEEEYKNDIKVLSVISNCDVTGIVKGEFSGLESDVSAVIQVYDGFGAALAKMENVNLNLKVDTDSEKITPSGLVSVASGLYAYRCSSIFDYNCPNVKFVYGFIGLAEDSFIEECYSKGKIVAKNWAYGFVGNIENKIIENCYSDCNIEILDSNNYATASIFGNDILGTLKNVYSVGTINFSNSQSKEKYFIGKYSELDNVYCNTQEVISSVPAKRYGEEKSDVKNLNSDEMKHSSSFIGFDFENVWGIDEGNGTPYLKWER